MNSSSLFVCFLSLCMSFSSNRGVDVFGLDPANKCGTGDSLRDRSGKEIECWGPGLPPCPASSFCSVHPTDVWAVCCPRNNTRPTNDSASAIPHPPAPPAAVPRNRNVDVFGLDPAKKCKIGNPLRDASGKEIGCAGSISRPCPAGTFCSVHPTDRWAVCCPRNDANLTTDKARPPAPPAARPPAPSGARPPAPPGARPPVPPGARPPAPPGAIPPIGNVDIFGLDPARKCGTVNSLRDSSGKEIECWGPGLPPCPAGSFCSVHPTDVWAVCCPRNNTNLSKDSASAIPASPAPPAAVPPIGGVDAFGLDPAKKCRNGNPLQNASGKEIECGGPMFPPCPAGSSCSIHPTDRWAVCCPQK